MVLLCCLRKVHPTKPSTVAPRSARASALGTGPVAATIAAAHAATTAHVCHWRQP